MSEKTVYLIRHGETDYNRRNIVQGKGVNPGLNDKGKQQASAFFEAYKEVLFEVVLTSTLLRTHETVAPFVEHGISWEIEPDIDELCWGIHEGKESTPEMKKAFYGILDEWRSGNFDACAEEGESAAEMGVRMERFVQHLNERPENCLLICSHGRSLRGLICALKEEPLTEMERYSSHNTALWKAQRQDGKWVFELENDIRHLALPELAPHK